MTTPPQGEHAQTEALRPIQRFEVVDCIDSKHVPAVIPRANGPWVRYEDHAAQVAALTAATAQPAAPQGVAYAEPSEFPAGAIVNGRTHIDRLESFYRFDCEAGPLINCDDWHGLKRCFEHLAERASNGQAPAASPWKDHQTREIVNQLRDCAKEYHATQQLRERLLDVLGPMIDWVRAVQAPTTAQAAPAGDLPEEQTQPWYDLAWRHGARRHTSFDGDELTELSFSPTQFDAFCADLAPAAGAVAGPTDATRNAWQQGYAQGVASALPSKVTPDMRRVFREGYREGGFWSDRLDYALEKMLAAAPTPAAQADSQPSSFGSPELQAMILARCVEKDKADSVLEDAMGLVNDIDTHMRSEWSAGRLPAVCWPLAFSDRIKALRAARKQGVKHD